MFDLMDTGYPRKNIKDKHFHINNSKNIIYIVTVLLLRNQF